MGRRLRRNQPFVSSSECTIPFPGLSRGSPREGTCPLFGGKDVETRLAIGQFRILTVGLDLA